jgi:hypothetical protein
MGRKKNMGNVTHEQANLVLKLYELRREPRLRQAREWFVANCHAKTFEEAMQKFPMGSVESTNLRMVNSYWEMVASIVNRGLIDEDFFFENNGELWIVWDRIRNWIPGQRAFFKNPKSFEHLENLGKKFDAWRERHAPGSTEALRQILENAGRPAAKAAN